MSDSKMPLVASHRPASVVVCSHCQLIGSPRSRGRKHRLRALAAISAEHFDWVANDQVARALTVLSQHLEESDGGDDLVMRAKESFVKNGILTIDIANTSVDGDV